MGKLSAEQARQLKELEELRDNQDDDEVVVWVRKGDHETRLTGARAERWLRANGYDEDDADDSTKTAPLEEKTGKATPAKKIVPGKIKTEKPADEESEELETDQPAPRRAPREFF